MPLQKGVHSHGFIIHPGIVKGAQPDQDVGRHHNPEKKEWVIIHRIEPDLFPEGKDKQVAKVDDESIQQRSVNATCKSLCQ